MADRLPILSDVIAQQRRSLLLWALALATVSAVYISFYPSIGGDAMDEMVAAMPNDLVTALGYDRIGTAGGWVTTTVYGLLGPILLLVFAIGSGARLVAGQEEDGTLELEVTSPISRRRILVERLAALWASILLLIVVLTITSWLLVVVLDMDVPLVRLVAGSSGLLLLIGGFGTVAFAVGAATGRRAVALGTAAALAVAAFMFDALGPVAELDWMTSVSPFSWYLGQDPLLQGFDVGGLVKLGAIPLVAWVGALTTFPRRDLMR